MTALNVPAAARTLLAKLDGWSVHQHASSGTAEFTALGDPRGDGTRPRVAVVEPVDSFLVRARHVDGRAFVAVWLSRTSRPSKAGRPSWSLDTAWRGRHLGEHTPRQVTAAQLKAYVAASGAATALAAVTPQDRPEGRAAA